MGRGKEEKKAYPNGFAADKTAFDERGGFLTMSIYMKCFGFQQRDKSSRNGMFNKNEQTTGKLAI